jgi:hypothetical protein
VSQASLSSQFSMIFSSMISCNQSIDFPPKPLLPAPAYRAIKL